MTSPADRRAEELRLLSTIAASPNLQAAYDLGKQHGIAIGRAEGAEQERAAVVAWMYRFPETSSVRLLVDDIESSAHIPTVSGTGEET